MCRWTGDPDTGDRAHDVSGGDGTTNLFDPVPRDVPTPSGPLGDIGSEETTECVPGDTTEVDDLERFYEEKDRGTPWPPGDDG